MVPISKTYGSFPQKTTTAGRQVVHGPTAAIAAK
jgi:hypothetical protein